MREARAFGFYLTLIPVRGGGCSGGTEKLHLVRDGKPPLEIPERKMKSLPEFRRYLWVLSHNPPRYRSRSVSPNPPHYIQQDLWEVS